MTVIEIDHSRNRARGAVAGANKPAKARVKRAGPVVPQAVSGRMRRIKWAILVLTLSIYYVTPFLRWDGGRVMTRLDRPRGLIDYESWRNIERAIAARPAPHGWCARKPSRSRLSA
ncbi:hypothetical protein QA640_13585 [Bradyrhizobium sp. CB82]|uniref:hypothetical protein n=1 Tax=Bradyrhizobium sp. CB82 TaxID=3039159 RepID=UPI0024B24D4E|nr:hypothetical protein [Bradyrhizobium sp. CB82]WFU43380.1 hypothetical protein QA640_13585 [Bradyrhizobium sp. CB82]